MNSVHKQHPALTNDHQAYKLSGYSPTILMRSTDASVKNLAAGPVWVVPSLLYSSLRVPIAHLSTGRDYLADLPGVVRGHSLLVRYVDGHEPGQGHGPLRRPGHYVEVPPRCKAVGHMFLFYKIVNHSYVHLSASTDNSVPIYYFEQVPLHGCTN